MKYTIKHPRKIIWVMRDFINEIHNVTYEGFSIKNIPGESFEDWWKRFSEVEATEFRATCKMIRIEANNFCAFISDKGDPIFRIGYNLNALNDKKDVRKTWNEVRDLVINNKLRNATLIISVINNINLTVIFN